MIWQPAFCKICAWLIYETNKPKEFVPSAHPWHQPSESALISLRFGRAWCMFLHDVTNWESKLVPVCRSFRRSTASSSWIKEDLWWPSDTRRCQLGTFGEGLLRSAPLLRLPSLSSSLFVPRLSVMRLLFFPPGWVLMKAETGTNIASPLPHSMLMACWGNLERTSW